MSQKGRHHHKDAEVKAEAHEPIVGSEEPIEPVVDEQAQEIARYKEEALRAKAEIENVRRRLERDISNAHKYGCERIVTDLLPVLDSLSRGMEEADLSDPKVQSLHTGMEMTLSLLRKVLEKNGITEIRPLKGDSFDPSQHEAMTMQKVAGFQPNTIVQVLQPGYALNGRMIRAAMVMVSH
jgi:molecular chaperone GrpE